VSKRGAFVGLILTGGTLAVPAHAEIGLWEGACTSFVIAGQQSVIGQVDLCDPLVAREVSGEGSEQRISFTFTMQGGNLALTFSGPLRTERLSETPVDRVTETAGPAYFRNSPASGTCRMAFPEIVCRAVTVRGPYEGRFLANPAPPKIIPDATKPSVASK